MKNYPLIHKPKNLLTSLPQIQAIVCGEGRFIRQGGNEHYEHVILQLEPNGDMNGCFMLWSVTGNSIPNLNLPADFLLTEDFLKFIYECLCEAITEELKGNRTYYTQYVPFPYENTNVRIIGGSAHPVDSRFFDFRRAAYLALAQAVSQL